MSGPGRGGAEGSGAAAAERGRAADCSPGTDTGLGGLRVPARSLEIKDQGGKTSGASFCCILGGVRPRKRSRLCWAQPCHFSLDPTRIFIFLVVPSLRLR